MSVKRVCLLVGSDDRVQARLITGETIEDIENGLLQLEDIDGLNGTVMLPTDQEQADEFRRVVEALQVLIGGFRVCPDCNMRNGLETRYCDTCRKELIPWT